MTNLSASTSAPTEAGNDAPIRSASAACAPSFAIIITDEDGIIEAWGSGAQDIFGYGDAEMVGADLSILAPPPLPMPDQIGRHKDPFDGPADAGWYRRKDGTQIFCHRTTSILANRPGEAKRHMWLLSDGTESQKRFVALQKKLFEQEVRCSQAESADASKDRCLALISHELRQPLTTILMRVERLLKLTYRDDSERIIDDLRAIRSAALRQAKIVSDLMELSRIRTGKIRLDPTLVNIGELVCAVAATLAEDAPDRTIHVCVDHASDHQCLVDPVRLEQMLSNLLHNAIKFCGIGGSIEVCVGSSEGFAAVSVADNGIGISQDFLPHVFSMFGQEMRSDPAVSDGLGIGLAVVKELAQAHGGRVSAHSDGPGRGSKFTVWLPLVGQTVRTGALFVDAERATGGMTRDSTPVRTSRSGAIPRAQCAGKSSGA